MSPFAQSLVVALIVAACAWAAFARYAPRTAWRLRAALSFAFERPGRPAWSRRVGAWLRPAVPIVTGCGSGASSACSACGSCAPEPPPAPRRAIDAQLLG
jgi:hypothetical protein